MSFISRSNHRSSNSTTSSRKIKLIAYGLVVLLVMVLVYRLNRQSSAPPSPSNPSETMNLQPAIITKPIDQEVVIPLAELVKGASDEDTLTYKIESVEKRKQIIVKGQMQTALNNRYFLILNLKLTNSYEKGLEINTRDYVRLKLNDSAEQLAPEIHNDPVEVQAISTKYTRVGFALDEGVNQFSLYLGEIKGEKQTIPVEL